MTSNHDRPSTTDVLFGRRLEAAAQRLADAGEWTPERDQRSTALIAASRAAGDQEKAARAAMGERPRDRVAVERFMTASRAHMRSIAEVFEIFGWNEAAELYRRIAEFPTESVDAYLANGRACDALLDALVA